MALTIHRAQGSEADRVTVLWPDVLDQGSHEERCLEDSSMENSPMDDHQRRLLYTAITRARVSLDLVSVV